MVITVFNRMDLYAKHAITTNPLDLRQIDGRNSSSLEKSLHKRKHEESKGEDSS